MKQGWWSLLLLLALLPASAAFGENIARIDRIQPLALEQQAGQRAGLFSERRFEGDDDGVRVIGNGQWRVQPRPGVAEPLLVVYHPYTARVTVLDTPDGAPRTQDVFRQDLDPQYTRRALVFPSRAMVLCTCGSKAPATRCMSPSNRGRVMPPPTCATCVW